MKCGHSALLMTPKGGCFVCDVRQLEEDLAYERKDKERWIEKSVPMKYRRMELNALYQRRYEEAKKRAEKAEAERDTWRAKANLWRREMAAHGKGAERNAQVSRLLADKVNELQAKLSAALKVVEVARWIKECGHEFEPLNDTLQEFDKEKP